MVGTAFDFHHEFSEAHEGIWWRHLAAYSDYTETVYYSALSVVIFTLLLILIVEGVRRKLEFSAADRPLFKSVLEGVYRELATLGIVELVIHNIHVYGNDTLDAGKESLFIDVHFALFYTAIFNAFQSVIIAIVATRFSREMWVHTEELELDHYVQIREEFDEVEHRLYGDHTRDLFQRIGSAICHPRLKARYNRLLVQVRFHQLRVHFLQAYNLPIQVKVSDYLMRTEKHVFEHLIHVSTAAWVWLTVLSNIIYYILGVSINETGDIESGGDVLSYIFFSSMVLFIFVTFIILWHMQATFEKILSMPHLWEVDQTDDEQADNEHDNALAEEQLNLFFGGDPNLLISITQYMQFGYAVALAMIVVFWNTLKEHDYFKPYYYLLSVLVCYFLFVLVMIRVLPRYTMCTSLGQLVDRQRLNETVSLFKLEGAKRRERMKLKDSPQGKKHSDEHSIKQVTTKEVLIPQQSLPLQEVDHDTKKYSLDDTDLQPVDKDCTRRKSSSESSAVRFMHDIGNESQTEASSTRDGSASLYLNKMNASTDSLNAMDLSLSRGRKNVSADSLDKLQGSGSSLRKEKRNGSSNSLDKLSTSYSTTMDTKRAEMLANLVLLDTESLRSVVTVEDKVKARRQRRKRYKAQSDGVALMRRTGMELQPVEEVEKASETVEEHHKTGDDDIVVPPRMSAEPSTEKEVAEEHASSGMHKLTPNDTEFSSTLGDDTNTEEHDDSCHDDLHIPPPISMSERLEEFLLGNKFKLVTHLMGSMFCFFLLGMRVEAFDEKNGILPVEDNTINFSLKTSFWMTFVWLVGFLLMSSGIITFLCSSGEDSMSRKRKEIWIASIFDVFLTALCLVLFLEAENLRCCDDADDSKKRVLEAYYDDPLVDGYEKYYASTICSCHAFGERLNGGLGKMEPFVAFLVALRSLRFMVARKLIELVADKDVVVHEHLDKKGHHGHDAHGGEVDHSSAVKLWQATIAQHPDIVAEYGEFSGELLRAMLGIANPQQVEFQKFDSLSQTGSKTIQTMAVSKPGLDIDEISL